MKSNYLTIWNTLEGGNLMLRDETWNVHARTFCIASHMTSKIVNYADECGVNSRPVCLLWTCLHLHYCVHVLINSFALSATGLKAADRIWRRSSCAEWNKHVNTGKQNRNAHLSNNNTATFFSFFFSFFFFFLNRLPCCCSSSSRSSSASPVIIWIHFHSANTALL